MDINSEEYKLWADIVNDITANAGDEAINIIEKVEEFCRLDAVVSKGVPQPVLRAVIEIIDSEPELDDEIPPEMLDRIKSGDVDFIKMAMKMAVKMTKDNIRDKVEILQDIRDSEQSC